MGHHWKIGGDIKATPHAGGRSTFPSPFLLQRRRMAPRECLLKILWASRGGPRSSAGRYLPSCLHHEQRRNSCPTQCPTGTVLCQSLDRIELPWLYLIPPMQNLRTLLQSRKVKVH